MGSFFTPLWNSGPDLPYRSTQKSAAWFSRTLFFLIWIIKLIHQSFYELSHNVPTSSSLPPPPPSPAILTALRQGGLGVEAQVKQKHSNLIIQNFVLFSCNDTPGPLCCCTQVSISVSRISHSSTTHLMHTGTYILCPLHGYNCHLQSANTSTSHSSFQHRAQKHSGASAFTFQCHSVH